MTESPQIAMGTAFIAGAWGHALIIWLHTFHCSKAGMILMRIQA